MSIPPLPYTWEGESLIVAPRFRKLADQHFVIGETYMMALVEERSKRSHDHQFAAIHEAWLNLPEHYGARWPTSKHLRKWALIKAGYCDQRSIVCPSRAMALRLAAFMDPMDEYAVVVPSEAVVTVYTAKSQSLKAMGREAFQASKTATLEIVAGLLDVTPAELSKATEPQQVAA